MELFSRNDKKRKTSRSPEKTSGGRSSASQNREERDFTERRTSGARRSTEARRNSADRRTSGERRNTAERRSSGDRRTPGDKRTAEEKKLYGERRSGDRRAAGERRATGEKRSSGERRYSGERRTTGDRRTNGATRVDNTSYGKNRDRRIKNDDDLPARRMKKRRGDNYDGETSDEPKIKYKRYYDYTTLVLILILVSFGLMMVASSSSYSAAKLGYPSTFFLKKQLKFAIAGVAGMVILSKLPYSLISARPLEKLFPNARLINRFTAGHMLYLFCAALQAVVLLMGKSANGSLRWMSIPIIGSFQPSEFSKLALLIFIAVIVSARPSLVDKFWSFFLTAFIPIAVISALVVVENLSTGIIMIGVGVVICFVASRKWLYFIATGGLVGAAGVLAISKVSYRLDRIKQWKNPDPDNQILQGMYAICYGGWFGRGIGNGVQKRGVIPEVHTDMIFTVICEELGFAGVCILMLAYALLLYRIYKIIVNAPDLFGSLLCVGAFAHIAIQVVLHVAVETSVIPATGVVLPFVSYGGTALVTTMIEMGLVLSVANRIEYEEE